MKTIYKLDSDDIRKIIASHFKVNEENVTIKVEEACKGYGMAEHYENVPVATVKIKNWKNC